MDRAGPRWLAAFAIAYGLLHHQGFVLARLGGLGDTGTRWADWLDLATPYLVLGPAAGVLTKLRAGTGPWLVFGAGAVAYVEGHGIHLAANSIDNALTDVSSGTGGVPVEVTAVVHLWDEPVGHNIWYGGLTVVVTALVWAAWSVSETDVASAEHDWWSSSRDRLAAVILALGFAFTYVTNALEGGTAPMALTAALGFVAWSVAIRPSRPAGRRIQILTLWAFAPVVVLLAGYGLIHQGFPSPTEIGWNPLA